MEAIICAVISAVTTLLVSIGTWQVSVRKDREKVKDELRNTLNEHYKKQEKDFHELKDELSDMGASLQQKIAVIEIQLNTLSSRVDKHNNVIERTYKLEQAVEDIRREMQ